MEGAQRRASEAQARRACRRLRKHRHWPGCHSDAATAGAVACCSWTDGLDRALYARCTHVVRALHACRTRRAMLYAAWLVRASVPCLSYAVVGRSRHGPRQRRYCRVTPRTPVIQHDTCHTAHNTTHNSAECASSPFRRQPCSPAWVLLSSHMAYSVLTSAPRAPSVRQPHTAPGETPHACHRPLWGSPVHRIASARACRMRATV